MATGTIRFRLIEKIIIQNELTELFMDGPLADKIRMPPFGTLAYFSVRHTYPRARQESNFAAIIEGEHPTTAGNNVDDEVGMLPDFELGTADIDRGAADMT
jgi:hypothetical protein